MGRRRATRWGAVAGLLVLLAACSSSTGGDGGSAGGTSGSAALPPCPIEALDRATQPVEVVVWHSIQAKGKDTFDELAERYNASQSRVRVRMENVAATDEELLQAFERAVPSRQLPALFVANDTMTQTMVDSGVVLPAQSCVNATGYDLSPLSPTVRAYYTLDGVLWAASANPGSVLVFYNKDHFRRAGLDPDKPPATLAELRADAEAIKRAGIVDTPFVHEVASYKTEFWLTGARAPIVDNDNGRSAAATRGALADGPAALDLFTWFRDMKADGLVQPIPVRAGGGIDQYLAMAAQKASIIVESSSGATSVEAFLSGTLSPEAVGADGVGDVSGLDIGAGPLPGLAAPGRTQMGGPAWFILSTQPPEVQAAAWDFTTFLNGMEAQTRLLTGASYLPYRTAAADTPEARAFFDASLAGRWLRIANQQVTEIDPAFPGPLIGPYDTVRLTLRDALAAVVFDGRPPADAVRDADAGIDEALRRYTKGGF